MADDSIPPAAEIGGGEERANNNSGNKNRNKRKTKPPPTKNGRAGKSPIARWLGRLSPLQWVGFGTHLILTIWLWIYLVESHELVPLIGFSATLLIAYTIAVYFLLKLFKSLAAILTVYCILVVATGLVAYKNSRPPPSSEIPPHPQSVIVQPDFIPGTTTTHKQLDVRFPFGYVVISFKDGNYIFDPKLRDDQLKIDVDWKRIKITPDFENRTVKWRVRITSMITPSIPQEAGSDLTIEQEFPMKVGVAYRYPASFDEASSPHIYFGTLSDNQVSPIFVMGFRVAQKPESAK